MPCPSPGFSSTNFILVAPSPSRGTPSPPSSAVLRSALKQLQQVRWNTHDAVTACLVCSCTISRGASQPCANRDRTGALYRHAAPSRLLHANVEGTPWFTAPSSHIACDSRFVSSWNDARRCTDSGASTEPFAAYAKSSSSSSAALQEYAATTCAAFDDIMLTPSSFSTCGSWRLRCAALASPLQKRPELDRRSKSRSERRNLTKHLKEFW
jgi:hypothetical protein